MPKPKPDPWIPTAVIVCPFYFTTDAGRHEVTRRIFRHYADQPHPVVGVGSEGDTSRHLFSDVFGAEDSYHEYPQNFDCFAQVIPGAGCVGLRQKFDFAIQAARPYESEYVFITGSDDLTPHSFFTPPFSGDLIGVGGEGASTNLWRVGTQGYARVTSSGFRGAELMGGPLGFSRAYLDAVNWRPFVQPHCEVGAERMARELGATVEARPLTFWQVKSGKVLNPIKDFATRWEWRSGEDDGEYAAFRRYYAELGQDG